MVIIQTILLESGIHIIKDQIFERTKAFNPVQTFQFITTFELYHERHLLDLAHIESRLDTYNLDTMNGRVTILA